MEYSFPTVLQPVKVPQGYYPIQVVQFSRGEYPHGHPYPMHWAIVVRTSADRGNRHEIVGDKHTYMTQARFDIPLGQTMEWRGSHTIGYVSPNRLNDLLNHIALVPVIRERWTWNCQNWVYDVLKGLNDIEMYTDVDMTLGHLQTHMLRLWEAWEEGDI
ncbi:hypothetical protein EV363DRAFT_1353507 [Boletus edulis]|nr:hypothetical protein EV363DRAFT_1353507 [Boletus edulis]